MSKKQLPCVILTGMPGAGKSTIGTILAAEINWAFMDTDHAIESLYAARLQAITDALGKEKFLDVECEVICAIGASHCIIATGGSVVYRPKAMAYLKKLGPVVYVRVDLEEIERRVAKNPERGIAMNPGQTLAQLLAEREKLYLENADLICDSGLMNPGECAQYIKSSLNLR